jgi:hypothetical protein
LIRVAILGGGHIGLALAALLGAREGCEVRLWGRSLPREGELRIDLRSPPAVAGSLYARADVMLCDAPDTAVADADAVVLAVPVHVRDALLASLSSVLQACRLLLIWEGCGRLAETVEAIGLSRPAIVGLQRSPLLCRAGPASRTSTGLRGRRTVHLLGARSAVVAATLRSGDRAQARRALHGLLPFRLNFAPDYACVRLSPGNPLIHPARLFACASAASPPGRRGKRFYADWDDAASQVLLALHGELARLRDARGLPRSHLRTLADAARPWTPAALTRATRAATTLRTVRLPLSAAGPSGRAPVWNVAHRFFAEDIGEGLATILADAEAAGVAMPTAAAIVQWYRELLATAGTDGASGQGGLAC